MELNVQTSLYHNIYLRPAILFSIINTMENAREFRLAYGASQYIIVYNQGPLLYNDGYVKVFDAYSEPVRMQELVDIKKIQTNFRKDDSLINEWLNEKYYSIFNLDEYYLENSYYYKRVHYMRDVLLYGCEENIYKIITNNRFGQFTRMKIPKMKFVEIINKSDTSIETCENTSDEYYLYIYLVKTKAKALPIFTIPAFYETLQAFFYAENNPQVYSSQYKMYGSQMYKQIADATALLTHNIEKIDYRAYAILAERYQIICDSLKYLVNFYKYSCFDSYIKAYQKMSQLMKSVLHSILKPCLFQEQKEFFRRAHEVIQTCAYEDEQCLNQICSCLEKCL